MKDELARQLIREQQQTVDWLKLSVKYLLYSQRDLLKANGCDTTGIDAALARLEERVRDHAR